MSIPEDHEVLDVIAGCLNTAPNYWWASREPGCVEFYDPENGQWFKVVVRAIDGPSKPVEPPEPAESAP